MTEVVSCDQILHKGYSYRLYSSAFYHFDHIVYLYQWSDYTSNAP